MSQLIRWQMQSIQRPMSPWSRCPSQKYVHSARLPGLRDKDMENGSQVSPHRHWLLQIPCHESRSRRTRESSVRGTHGYGLENRCLGTAQDSSEPYAAIHLASPPFIITPKLPVFRTPLDPMSILLVLRGTAGLAFNTTNPWHAACQQIVTSPTAFARVKISDKGTSRNEYTNQLETGVEDHIFLNLRWARAGFV